MSGGCSGVTILFPRVFFFVFVFNFYLFVFGPTGSSLLFKGWLKPAGAGLVSWLVAVCRLLIAVTSLAAGHGL